ncbi:hypothetical protein ACIPJS_28505, partial [Streptomyces sp. NPDC086783]|uniref:hypothetical protein n=1 Tax=Streptomyces sp. NPDC086783 TaxID=3365758 RepID=UPI0038200BC0
SVLRFRLYQTVSGSDFLGAFQVSAFAFPFPATPTLPDLFGPDSLSAGFVFGRGLFVPQPFDIHYVNRFPVQLIIEPASRNSTCGHDEFAPAEGKS